MEFLPGLTVWILVWVTILIKKKRQLGRTWEGPVSARVTIKDHELTCSLCRHNKFSKREGLLNTSWVMLFHLGFWNRSTSCFVCRSCGFIHWFLSPDEIAEYEHHD